MDNRRFNNIVKKQMVTCEETLTKKGKEYSMDEDRLGQFYKASLISGLTPMQCLSLMMVKHSTSIHDLIQRDSNNIQASIEVWEEKITDNINYLFLLKALMIESLEKKKGVELYDHEPRGPKTPYDRLEELSAEISEEDSEDKQIPKISA